MSNGQHDPIGRWGPWQHKSDGGWWFMLLIAMLTAYYLMGWFNAS